jgi:hypothetical protein
MFMMEAITMVTPVSSELVNTKSLLLDGVDEYIVSPYTSDIDFSGTQGFSWCWWFKRDTSKTSNQQFIDNRTSGGVNHGQMIFFDDGADKLRVIIKDSSGNTISVFSSTAITDANWHHAAFTYSGNQSNTGVELYLDGAGAGKTSPTGTISASTSNTEDMRVGRNVSDGNAFKGNIDNIAIYDRELTAAEVSAIYSGGTPPNLVKLATSTSMVRWYRLDDGVFGTDYTFADNSRGATAATSVNIEIGDLVTDSP